MAYCTYTDVQNLTGSDLSQTILTAIIDQGDREINVFLDKYGLTGSTSIGACKAASLKFAQAGVYEMSGNTSGVQGLYNPIRDLRAAAYDILAHYVASSASTTSSVTRVRRIAGI